MTFSLRVLQGFRALYRFHRALAKRPPWPRRCGEQDERPAAGPPLA